MGMTPEERDRERERLRQQREENEWRRAEREAKRRADCEVKAQHFVALRDASGLTGDADAFEAAFDACVGDWQAGCKASRYNDYVWRGPEDTTVADLASSRTAALKLLEGVLDDSAVHEIKWSEGFLYCLNDGYDSDVSQRSRAKKVTVTASAANSYHCDAYGLLEYEIGKLEHNQAALRSLEPLLRGVSVAALLDCSDNHTCDWDEGSYWADASVLVFEFGGRTFSLVTAHMGWRYEWDD